METCDSAQAHLNDFLDGVLGAAKAQEINAHLQDCAVCGKEYRALKATQELVHNAPVLSGEEARQRVMARFRQSMDRSIDEETQTALPAALDAVRIAWRKRLLPYGVAAAMAGALCLVALLPFRVSNGNSSEGTTGAQTPIIIATASCTSDLPTADNLDQMASAHEVQSLTVQNGSAETQQESLADANSRLSSPSVH